MAKQNTPDVMSKITLEKIKPVFEALQRLTQREIIMVSEVKPALDAYCSIKEGKLDDKAAETATADAVTVGGLEAGRLALLALYATPISLILLPIVNAILSKSGLDVTLELVQIVPLVTIVLKTLDRSIHEYGKLIKNEFITKAITRF